MIDKDGVYCDGPECKATECNHYMGFKAKTKVVQDLGWRIRRVAGQWKHYCPDCPIGGYRPPLNKQPPTYGTYWWDK